MGKRKHSKEVEAKRKKIREENDAKITLGVFSEGTHGNSSDVEGNWEMEEQDYEMQPRKMPQKIVEALPIKTFDGKIERVIREVEEDKEEEAESENEVEKPAPVSGGADEGDDSEEEANLPASERLAKMKDEIADLATKVMEDPEENTSALTRLRRMSESKNSVRSRLAIMALIPVFKSLAPSYVIRPLTDLEKKEKVSKEVARLRNFEQSLVRNYISYVDLLSSLAKVSRSNSENNRKVTEIQIKLGSLATTAACELCDSSLKHFNARKDLISIVVRRLNKRPNNPDDLQIFLSCIRILETMLKEDEENGDITFDIVTLLSTSIRQKKFRVDESVINIFLSLSLLNDYDPQSKEKERPQKLKKGDKVHLSKKERKARKERKQIEAEMRKAEQAITKEQREKYQANVLKMLLSLYLETLKAGSHTSLEPNNQATVLVAPVLEGLSRFGQMANFDLLGDFLEVLREIMSDITEDHSLDSEDDSAGGIYDGTQIRTILLCIATSFSLFTNHISVGKLPISIDLSRFISGLYMILADVALDCDLELSHKTLRLADPLKQNALEKPSVNVSTKSELLLRCLDFIFFRSKNGSLPRATTFIKRLYILSLHSPEKTSLAVLKFVGKLVARYGDSLKGLWSTTDSIAGDGSYVLGIERSNKEVVLDRSNGNAATLWENVLLDSHYCPLVKDGSRSLLKNSKVSDIKF